MKFLSILYCMLMLSIANVQGVQVEVTQGTAQPIPIAMIDFSADGSLTSVARDMAGVIQSDLKSTGLFEFLSPQAFIETDVSVDAPPRFVDWRLLNTQVLLVGRVERAAQGGIQVTFRLWDIYGEHVLIEQSLQTQEKYWRRIAHIIADKIYSRLTGENGYFDTRIVYVTEEAKGLKQKKRLAIMDQDGAGHKHITDGKHLVLTPRFSPNLQKITYLSYEKKAPRVFVLDLETGQHELVGHFPGMTFAPRFSPDGKQLIMSQALDGNSDIYLMNLENRVVRRLTNTSAINTSPCFSPDGEAIVFNSDRGGTKQLYVMSKTGKSVKRISYGGGIYSTPVWSPRGDYIAFTKTQGGKFYIGVMRPDGTAERLIATGFIVESPTWAPNGRTLMYTKQQRGTAAHQGDSGIFAIDVTGANERRLPTPGGASDPAWSPGLPTA